MSEFQIEFSPTENDLRQMIMLDNRAYKKQEDRGILEKCLAWKRACPDLYTALKHNGTVVGYINFLPVTKKCYEKFRNGKLKDFEIAERDVLPFKKGDNYCIFVSIVIAEKFRNTKGIHLLMMAWRNRILVLQEKGVQVKKILADCVSEEGVKLSQGFNGKLVKDTQERKIFEFAL